MSVPASPHRVMSGAFVSAAIASIFIAGAQVSAQGGVIRACVNAGGSLRLAPGGEACKPTESLLTWNVEGKVGPAGPAGPTGPTGPDGPAGRDGRDATTPAPPAPTTRHQMTIAGMNGGNPTPIQAFSLGASNPAVIDTGGGGAAGKVNFADLSVLKMIDGLTVPLLKATATGTFLAEVKLEVFQIGTSVPFATYTFSDALVTAHALGGSPASISESVSFAYGKIASSITLGGMTFDSCYDLKAAKSC
jgi:type VI protein secretion system component Hcp